MKPFDEQQFALSINRRTFLSRSAYGLGGLALASMLNPFLRAAEKMAGTSGGIISPLHFPQKVKRVIHLCMAGGPSHLETFDFKPKLKELHGKPFPESFTKGQQLAQLQNTELKARGPFVDFKKYGKSGQEISDLFPHIAKLADDLCIVRSMHTEQINHDPAHAFMNTGSIIKGRPSMGSWLLYGLGAETENLPGYVVLTSQGKTGAQPVSARQWSAGFLPSKFQGIQFQSKGDAVHYVGNPEGVCQSTQRQIVEEVQRLNGMLAEEMPKAAEACDRPSAALIQDLKHRGLLEDTLIIWGGEFGRTPMGQGSGRDHHINAFSIFLAGGGIKGGTTWGSTDELGYKFIEDDQKVHVHDLHATMLYLCGIDHKKLTFRYQGRDFRLTDVSGNVVKGILA